MSSAPIPSTAPPLGGSNGMPPPAFGAPPPLAGKRAMTTGGRKPMRSRYVDVFNQPPSS
ncbi:hypothetical protein CLU79DRAFT_727632 [Phycomyces nitens]|nr:hypothetical protein CLU79DRAFT_727632 [Phycomyces nitens]